MSCLWKATCIRHFHLLGLVAGPLDIIPRSKHEWIPSTSFLLFSVCVWIEYSFIYSSVSMGNCCGTSATSDGHVFSSDERHNPVQASGYTQQSPGRGHAHNASSTAANTGSSTHRAEGGMTPDSFAEVAVQPAEPQQLEHIADREGILKFFLNRSDTWKHSALCTHSTN